MQQRDLQQSPIDPSKQSKPRSSLLLSLLHGLPAAESARQIIGQSALVFNR